VPPTIEELTAEFPNLEFVRPLGSGGMGAVYLAKQVRLDRPVAVKVLPPDLADDGAFAERFLREARALARLSHPNIVGVFDFGQTPGGLYFFLMEYIEGPTLRQVVASRSADPKQALEIVRQVCDALQFAHDKGVVHRDIKPENILLDSQGRVKIADFGLAKLLGLADTPAGSPAAGSLTHTRQAMGTPHYMAPEQIVGSRGVDHRADIYSLGVVFYELLTGELPLGRFAPPSRKVHIDVRLDDVVLRTLEAEPDERYQRAGDVRTAVDTISSLPPQRAAAGATAMRFVRDATAGVGNAARTVLQPAGPGEMSRKAIVGLVWGLTAPLAIFCGVLAAAFEHTMDPLAALFAVMGIVLALPAIASLVGAPVLGVMGIREVRASSGRIIGLVPALAATLFFPFLLLYALIFWTLAGFFMLMFGDEEPAFIAAAIIGNPLALWATVRIVRAAWRKATEGLSQEIIERELEVIPPGPRRAAATMMRWCDRVWASFRGLFGLVPQEYAAVYDDAGAAAPAAPARASRNSAPSRKAAIGAAWAATSVVGFLLFLFVVNTNHGDPVLGVAVPLLGLFALPALTAPFGTTALGWAAISEFRRSAARPSGLPLAVFDALAFPLLALDVLICVVTAGVTALLAFVLGLPHAAPPAASALGVAAGVAIAVGLCALADGLIVRAVWRRAHSGLEPPAGDPAEAAGHPEASAPRRGYVGWGITAAVIVVLALFSFKAAREAHRPLIVLPPAAPIPPIPHDEQAATPASEDPNSRWQLGPNGPELGHFWAAYALGVDGPTEAAVNGVLRDVSAEYERLLDSHTTVAFDGRAVTFTIAAFPEEYDRLADEFWSRVDALLNRDQQAIMRFNFPLRYDPSDNVLTERYEGKLMPFGARVNEYQSTTTIRIARSGQWYDWTISMPDMGTGSQSPELPAWLRRWQERFDVLMSVRKAGLMIDPARPPLVARKPRGPAASINPFGGLGDPFGSAEMVPAPLEPAATLSP
jgi:predicted Ser/Thr protein kinase